MADNLLTTCIDQIKSKITVVSNLQHEEGISKYGAAYIEHYRWYILQYHMRNYAARQKTLQSFKEEMEITPLPEVPRSMYHEIVFNGVAATISAAATFAIQTTFPTPIPKTVNDVKSAVQLICAVTKPVATFVSVFNATKRII